MIKKEWKPIVGYEDKYLISNYGDVFSIRANRELSLKHNHDGYLRIQLWNKQVNQYRSVHILVMEAFTDKPFDKAVVNHKDGNKQNNKLDNLEWVTQKENIKHAWNSGLSNRKNHGKIVYIHNGDNHVYSYGNASETSEILGKSFSAVAMYARQNKTVKGLTYSYDYNL